MMMMAGGLFAGCHVSSKTADSQTLTSLDEGKLQVESLFGSAISNPDCNMEDGDNTASLQIKNVSGKYLKQGVGVGVRTFSPDANSTVNST